jgi:hypothetical protein
MVEVANGLQKAHPGFNKAVPGASLKDARLDIGF